MYYKLPSDDGCLRFAHDGYVTGGAGGFTGGVQGAGGVHAMRRAISAADWAALAARLFASFISRDGARGLTGFGCFSFNTGRVDVARRIIVRHFGHETWVPVGAGIHAPTPQIAPSGPGITA
jgi:hypothetical protein